MKRNSSKQESKVRISLPLNGSQRSDQFSMRTDAQCCNDASGGGRDTHRFIF